MNLPHMQPKTYDDAVAEGQRVKDLRREVHISMLAEYVRVKFLSNMGKLEAYEKYLQDIEIGISVFTLYRWMQGTAVWLKVPQSVREEHHAFTYYVEAAASREYQTKKITATEAVIKAKGQRYQRHFRQCIYALSALADNPALDQAPPSWLHPEYAGSILERLPLVTGFLKRAADERVARKRRVS